MRRFGGTSRAFSVGAPLLLPFSWMQLTNTCAFRGINVGPGFDEGQTADSGLLSSDRMVGSTPKSSSEAVRAAFESPVIADFGSVKRREQRRNERMIRNKAAMEALDFMQRVISRPSPQEELEAQSILRDMGFVQKPPSCVYYRQFLSELRRYKMEIGMIPNSTAVQLFSLIDYGIDGKGEAEVRLCDELRSATETEDNLPSDLHEAVGIMLYSTKPVVHTVRVTNEARLGYDLEFESVFPLSGDHTESRAVAEGAATEAEELAHREQERLLNEALKLPFEPIPGGPYRRYLHRVNCTLVNKQNGTRKALFANMSVQCLVYMFIMSMSRFMKLAKATDNCPFDTESVLYLRYSFVNLRQQIGMEPIGDFELDALLPKIDE